MSDPVFVQVGGAGPTISDSNSADGSIDIDQFYPNAVPATPPAPSAPPPATTTTPPAAPPTPTPTGDPPNLSDKPPDGTNWDLWAKGILAQAWLNLFGVAPSPVELQMEQAHARLEGHYGWPNAEKFPEWQGHHNWGAINCMTRINGVFKSCYQDGECVHGFLGRDRIDGKTYPVCFDHQDTNIDGAMKFLKVAVYSRKGVAAALPSGDCYRVAYELRKSGYYMRTKNADEAQMQADAAYYAHALYNNAKAIVRSTGGALLVSLGVPSSVKPSSPASPGWPALYTDLAGPIPMDDGPSIVGPIVGIAVGVLGALGGRWAYKRWVKP